MASKEIKGTEYACDAECGTVRLVAEGAPKPDGYHIPLVDLWSNGSLAARAGAAVWACKPGCLRKAVENAVGRSYLATEAEAVEQEDDDA
jgi:hypothetical protein